MTVYLKVITVAMHLIGGSLALSRLGLWARSR